MNCLPLRVALSSMSGAQIGVIAADGPHSEVSSSVLLLLSPSQRRTMQPGTLVHMVHHFRPVRAPFLAVHSAYAHHFCPRNK